MLRSPIASNSRDRQCEETDRASGITFVQEEPLNNGGHARPYFLVVTAGNHNHNHLNYSVGVFMKCRNQRGFEITTSTVLDDPGFYDNHHLSMMDRRNNGSSSAIPPPPGAFSARSFGRAPGAGGGDDSNDGDKERGLRFARVRAPRLNASVQAEVMPLVRERSPEEDQDQEQEQEQEQAEEEEKEEDEDEDEDYRSAEERELVYYSYEGISTTPPPTASPFPAPTSVPTQPTSPPTLLPTRRPTAQPTDVPIPAPSSVPLPLPTLLPTTVKATFRPTEEQFTDRPTAEPTSPLPMTLSPTAAAGVVDGGGLCANKTVRCGLIIASTTVGRTDYEGAEAGEASFSLLVASERTVTVGACLASPEDANDFTPVLRVYTGCPQRVEEEVAAATSNDDQGGGGGGGSSSSSSNNNNNDDDVRLVATSTAFGATEALCASAQFTVERGGEGTYWIVVDGAADYEEGPFELKVGR